MDEILEELLAGVGALLDKQTLDIQRAMGSGQEKAVTVAISGNSLSLIDTVCKDAEAANKLKNVATSFGLLNTQLDKYEETILKLDKAVNAGNNVSKIIESLNSLTDSDIISRMEDSEQALDAYAKVIVSFFESIGAAMSGNNIQGFSATTKDDIISILDIVNTISSPEFGNSLKEASSLLTKDVATNIGMFVQELVRRFDEIQVSNAIMTNSGVYGIIELVKALSSEDFGRNLQTSSTYLKPEIAIAIGDFLVTLINKMKEVNEIGKDGLPFFNPDGGIYGLIEVLKVLTKPDFGQSLQSSSTFLNVDIANNIGDFLIALVKKFKTVDEITQGNLKIFNKDGSIKGIIDVISTLSADDFGQNLKRTSVFLSSDVANNIGDFLIALLSKFKEADDITDGNLNIFKKNGTIYSITELVRALSTEDLGRNLKRSSEILSKEIATNIGDFLIALLSKFKEADNQIGSDLKNFGRNSGVYGIIEFLKVLSKDDFAQNLKASSEILDKQIATNIGDFLVTLINKFNEVDSLTGNFGKNSGIYSIIDAIEALSQDNFGENLKKSEKYLTRKVANNIGDFLSVLIKKFADIPDMNNTNLKASVEPIINLLKMVTAEDFVKNLDKANRKFGLNPLTGRYRINPATIPTWIGLFMDTFAQKVKATGISADTINGINSVINIIKSITDPEFIKNLRKANLMYGGIYGKFGISPTKTPEWFGKFLTAMAEAVNGKTFDKTMASLQNVVSLISSITEPKFMFHLLLANRLYATKGMGISPVKTPQWFGLFLDEMAKAVNGKDFDKTVSSLQSVVSIIEDITSTKFMFHLLLANRLYATKGMGISPTKVPDWFNKFVTAMDQINIDEKFKKKVESLNTVQTFIEWATKPSLLFDLMLANMAYSIIGDGSSITNFYSVFIDKLNEIFEGKAEQLKNAQAGVEMLKNIVEGINHLGLELLLAGIIGLAVIPALPGILVLLGTTYLIVTVLEHLAKKMEEDGEKIQEGIMTIGKCILLLTASILILTIATILAEKVTGEGFMKLFLVFIELGVLILFVLAISKLADKASEGLVQICLCLLALSAAMMFLTYATVLANDIKPEGMVALLGVLLAMAILTGILWLIQVSGIGPMAILAGLGIALLLLVLTVVMMLILKVLAMATSIVKDLPMIKMLVEGIVDIMWSIAGKAALMGVIMPLIAVFALGVMILMVAVTLSILVMKLARLYSPKDKIALKNVLNAMIMAFDVVDGYFEDNTFGSSIPVAGALLKMVTAIGGFISLVAFSLGIMILMAAVTLSILVMKLARIYSPKDGKALKDVLGAMIDAFGMVDGYFDDKTFGSSIPVAGAIAKAVSAIGGFVSLVAFSLGIGILMLVTTLSIGVMKLAKTVKKSDVDGLKMVIQGMLDIFDSIGGTFLFGLLDNISKALSAGLFAAAMTPILGLVTWYIHIVKKYKEADKETGGLAKAGQDLVSAFHGFFDSWNNSFSFMDMIAMGVKSVISTSLMPMMAVVGQFVDVVAKVATMTFVTGYDKNGKPMYQKVPASAFGDAASTVSKGFKEFMDTLGKAFDGDIKDVSADLIEDMGEAMIPMMNALSGFTDAIVKLATAQVADKWDKNGKPVHFITLDGPTVSAASTTLCSSFSTFMTDLGTNIKNLDEDAMDVMDDLKDAIMPLMSALSSFTDSIIKLGQAKVADKWDKNGNPTHYMDASQTVFSSAAQTLNSSFSSFVVALANGLKDIELEDEDSVKCIAEITTTLMSGISDFADAIVKLGSLQIAEEYYSNGKVKKWKTLGTDDFKKIANFLVGKDEGVFLNFILDLGTGFGYMGTESRKTLETISESVEPLMTGISDFVDSIVKMATSTYVDHYDKNGKPVMKHIDPNTYKIAANVITNSFSDFLLTLRYKLFNTKGAIMQTLDMLNKGGIGEFMTSVSNFVDALGKYATGLFVIKGFDKDGKPIYAKDKGGGLKKIDMKAAAQNIALGFSQFVLTLAFNLSKPALKQNMEASKNVIAELGDLMDPVSDFIDDLIKVNEKKEGKYTFESLGKELGTGLISILWYLDMYHTGKPGALKGYYGTESFATALSSATESIAAVLEQVEDLIDIDFKGDLVKKCQDLGSGAISILRSFDTYDAKQPNVSAVSKFGSQEFTDSLNKAVENIRTLISVAGEFASFMEWDFKAILAAEKDFHSDVKFLMTMDFTTFDTSLKNSVAGIIATLTSLDKKFKESTTVVYAFQTAVVKTYNKVAEIERKLDASAQKRNERFKQLTDNIDKVTERLTTLQQGFEKLKNNGFESYLNSLSSSLQAVYQAGANLDAWNKQNGNETTGANQTYAGGNTTTNNTVVSGGGGTNLNGQTFKFTFINGTSGNITLGA